MLNVRSLTCAETKVSFPYTGRGRPPLYCPEVSARRLVERQRAASKKSAEKKAAAKRAKKHAI